MNTALKLSNVSKIYPGTVALRKVNFEVGWGEVHGIIGKNGAGKSTLVGIIAGMVTPTEGEIQVGDTKYKCLSRMSSKKIKISIVPQEPQVVLDFSVAENLFMADYIRHGCFVDWKKLYDRAEQIVKSVNLDIDVRAKAGDLSVSEQQLLLVLKACYVENARIIILDEASASLTQEDEQVLFDIVREQKKKGNTVLYISHRTDELLKICDRLTVLRDGRSIKTLNSNELDRDSLSALIVGQEAAVNNGAVSNDAARQLSEETILSVEGITLVGSYHNISFKLRKGEILGLAGLRGSGRTEILKGIAGVDPVERGKIKTGNFEGRFSTPAQALKHGIVYLPEDREREGLINSHSIKENLAVNSLPGISRAGIINKRKEKQLVEKLIEDFDIKVASLEQEVNQLSGGNKQKVVVGRISAANPKVFLLDEPTRGVDIAAKAGILKAIKNRLSKNAGVIITSPGIDDLMEVCHRILIIYKGEIKGEFSKENFSEIDIYTAMQGH